MSDLITYAPALIILAVLWASHSICEAIGESNRSRHVDHDELLSELSELRQILFEIEASTNGMARVVDPPPTVDQMIDEFERKNAS